MGAKTYNRIAVIGVSQDAEKYGYRIFRDLIKAGYPVIGVNPKGGFVLGRLIYKSLEELEPKPDLVITVTPPEVTEEIVEQCNKLGIKNVWMQPGSGSDKILAKALDYGIKTTAACFMVQEGLW